MLNLFRRHSDTCKHRSKGRKYRSCGCSLAVEGRLHGKYIRKSLDLRSWEAAQKIVREWEVNGEGELITVNDAADKFLKDAEVRLKPQTVKKYKHLVKEVKAKWGNLPVRSVSVDDVRTLRNSWDYNGTTARKRLELLRGFFSFCLGSGWITRNPAKGIKNPLVEGSPSAPFSDSEWRDIFTALDVYKEVHTQSPSRVWKQLKALILLLRSSGLRISDCCALKRERIDKNGRLFVHALKNNKPVWLPLPPKVSKAIDEADGNEEYIFWNGEGALKTCITEWQERLKKIAVLAGIKGRGFAHRCRASFSVELLNKGVPLEMVATILGNSARIVEKHYSLFVKSRQVSIEKAVKATW
jgi:integrase/recombinase XerC